MDKGEFVMKKIMICLFSFLFIFLSTNNGFAQNSNVSIGFPKYNIIINDEIVDAEAAYPFITYKDITYLPLTYNNFTKMGLYASLSQTKDGFEIFRITKQSNVFKELLGEEPEKFNKKNTARIPTYKIIIRDLNTEKIYEIDNLKIKYPFLNYEGVTYLPLTWENVKIFNWTVIFDKDLKVFSY